MVGYAARRDAMTKQNETYEPTEADLNEVVSLDVPEGVTLEEVMAKVMRTPNSAIKTPLVEDEESIRGTER